MAPRNSQEPSSRDDEIGVLALPAETGAGGERFLHQRRRIDEDLHIGTRKRV